MPARPDNLHSRLVFWLKILLPLAALAILSTLFLISRGVRPEDAIPYGKGELEDRLRSPRLTEPDFAGVTADGAALSLKAAEVVLGPQDGAVPADGRDLTGLLETPDGVRTELAAKAARFDQEAGLMVLSGGVDLTSSSGYRISTPGLTVALDRTELTSQGAVTATGPAFDFEAGSMRLALADAGAGTYLLVFNGGVRMLYRPQMQGTTP